MRWRQILGWDASIEDLSPTHYQHDPQEYFNLTHCADNADIAHVPKDSNFELRRTLEEVCCSLSITPGEVESILDPKEIEELRKGILSNEWLESLAQILSDRKLIDQGVKPQSYQYRTICKSCGPIWLWFEGEVLTCPWCFNQKCGKPVPDID